MSRTGSGARGSEGRSGDDSLTDVPGIRVGHAEVEGGGSGCTVILGPFRAAADVRGMATGTRELDALSPSHLVPRVDALLLTGGSAYGLGAADGVMAWLEDRGEGFTTPAGPVPIVPTAVIYDLASERPRPGPGVARKACEEAGTEPVACGRVGAGAGALVGKIEGRDRASPGGLGSASRAVAGSTVGALAVVNALGDVRDGGGRILAGARKEDGSFLDTARVLREEGASGEFGATRPGESTTLAVVATDAPLAVVDLGRLARMASTALARRISPVNTPFDGDVTFALSTAEEEERPASGEILALGAAATEALERAIERAVGGPPSGGESGGEGRAP
ncbi:MAG: peptidase S58 family protein [Gemmatimonadetes bacterium]|nr:P1 family peptidase [Gemmatimonadota bacterium]NIR81129.1 P1 family peptidase [Gemmatimonadota bacterium]NIT89953.1 P1 family peptidase [Gemmatimonadota bacterium]NIU33754.1 P1 family peptidase [Gemmatimonadota bacterium]NIU37985.1 peptidase S58 family protein [Gemmatimonadota bacterium]